MAERRNQEMRDAGMISEDHGAVANMPQEVKYVSWPKNARGLEGYLDDSIRGIDKQMNEDEGMAHRHNAPHKW